MNRVCENSPGLLGIVGPLARPPVARQANVTDNEFVEIRVDVEENPGRNSDCIQPCYKLNKDTYLEEQTTCDLSPLMNMFHTEKTCLYGVQRSLFN